MIRAFIASFRLAFALVCVGVGLLLGAQWLGLIPNTHDLEESGRRKFCETVAISLLDDIGHSRWVKVQNTLELLVEQNPMLLSLGLRTDFGSLRSSTTEHHRCWDGKSTERWDESAPDWALSDANPNGPGPKGSAMHDARTPAVVEVDELNCTSVPVMINHRPWGRVEFCFRNPEAGPLAGLIDHGLTRLLVFFVVVGLGSYTIMMMRIMGVFTKTSAVPDGVRHALDTLAEGLLVLDDSGHIVLANQTFVSINGYEADELHGRPAAELPWTFAIGKDEGPVVREFPLTRVIEQGQSIVGDTLRLTGRDGVLRVFSINAASVGEAKQKRGALVTFQDVTHVEKHRVELENMLSMLRLSKDEIQKKNQELEVLATRDALTGCLNRRAFFERMTVILEEHRRQGIPLSCFMVDVDHFKKVNDTYGHHTGDEVLRKVAKVLRDLHEEKQIVCRYGGEEFCVMLPGSDLDEAMIHAECTRMALTEIRLTDPASLRLTASLGVSELRFGANDVQELINQADACLYVAKRGGRNQSVAYDPDRIEAMGSDVTQAAEKIPDPDLGRLPFHAVTALVSALAYRDRLTAEHSRRVANLCVKAASGLMCQRDIYLLEMAALLHDIGRLAMPDEVVDENHSSPNQVRTMIQQRHQIGVEMIRGTFHCGELTSLVEGYRCGGRVPKSEVSVGASLLAMADAYDRIVFDASPRPGHQHGEAVKALNRELAKQYDAKLVNHFFASVAGPEFGSALGIATTVGIALAVPKATSAQIGEQIQQLCEMMDAEDVVGVKTIAAELAEVATEHFLLPIVESATRINQTPESAQWGEVLADTRLLLERCRATQNAHLIDV